MKEIEYYKINEALSNRYYQIPQELFESPLYKDNLNSDSKILYAFLLDRLSLSIKNHWIDKEDRIYSNTSLSVTQSLFLLCSLKILIEL